jgi:hypothetical protein
VNDDRDVGALEEKLSALDAPITHWRDARERAFAAQFRPKRGQLSTLMSKLPKAAAGARGVGPGPQEAAFAALDEVCEVYLESDPQRCAVIRGLVHRHEIRRLLGEYIGHASQVLAQGGRPEWLDRALAAASIDDQRVDYRDWLMSLGDIYLSARTHGIDPAPAFKRVAEISNAEPHRAAPTTTKDAMSGFERSAYFATSILPRLR